MYGFAPDRGHVSRSNAAGKRRASEAGSPVDLRLGTDEIANRLASRAYAWCGYRCYLCGVAVTRDEQWHLDHVEPLAAGGGHLYDNLEMACSRCNLFKSDLSLTKFLDGAGWSKLQPL